MRERGLTMIEIIIIIAIIGILAAIAIPKYIDLTTQTRQAALNGLIGAINSGSVVNYAARKAGNTSNTIATSGANCTTVVPALLSGGVLPSGYTVTSKVLSTTVDSIDTCTINSTAAPALNTTANILIIH